MARSQENGITILLGLKDYRVGEVVGGEERVVVQTAVKGRERKCPYCSSAKLYRHGICKPRQVLHTWSNGRRVCLELYRHRWRCRNCGHTFAEGRELVRSSSRLTRQAEAEALWQLKDRNFSQVRRELGVGYGTLRRLLEMEIDEEALGFIQDEDEIYLGIDEHSFRHQELVHSVTEVKQRKVLGILRDDRIATLKKFLNESPHSKLWGICGANSRTFATRIRFAAPRDAACHPPGFSYGLS